jgi:hypothetical protein
MANENKQDLLELDFIKIQSIWIMASRDENPLMTYYGIADRLNIEYDEAKRLKI